MGLACAGFTALVAYALVRSRAGPLARLAGSHPSGSGWG